MKISIITICFNEARQIEETIRSVVTQTARSSIEYIVVDGGSTDGTVEILEKYRDDFDQFISEADNGIYNAMNKGGALATGDYLLFLNGGDYLVRDTVISDLLDGGLRGEIVHGHIITQDGRRAKDLRGIVVSDYLRRGTLPHQGTLISEKLFGRVGGYDESYRIRGDYDFFVRAVFHYHASTQHVSQAIAVFNLEGVSNREVALMNRERARVQEGIPPRKMIERAALGLRSLRRKVRGAFGRRRAR